MEPIVKSAKEWFVTPEYLAPEIIKAIAFNQGIEEMSKSSASDIWYSLDNIGLLVWPFSKF